MPVISNQSEQFTSLKTLKELTVVEHLPESGRRNSYKVTSRHSYVPAYIGLEEGVLLW